MCGARWRERITDEVTATALRLRTSPTTSGAVDQVVDEVRCLGALAVGRSTEAPTATPVERATPHDRDWEDPLAHLHQEVEAARRALESSRAIRPPAPQPSEDRTERATRPGSDA